MKAASFSRPIALDFIHFLASCFKSIGFRGDGSTCFMRTGLRSCEQAPWSPSRHPKDD